MSTRPRLLVRVVPARRQSSARIAWHRQRLQQRQIVSLLFTDFRQRREKLIAVYERIVERSDRMTARRNDIECQLRALDQMVLGMEVTYGRR